jgi:hypothetical protein
MVNVPDSLAFSLFETEKSRQKVANQAICLQDIAEQ